MVTPAASWALEDEEVPVNSRTIAVVFLELLHVTVLLVNTVAAVLLLCITSRDIVLKSYCVVATDTPCESEVAREEQPPYTA